MLKDTVFNYIITHTLPTPAFSIGLLVILVIPHVL